MAYMYCMWWRIIFTGIAVILGSIYLTHRSIVINNVSLQSWLVAMWSPVTSVYSYLCHSPYRLLSLIVPHWGPSPWHKMLRRTLRWPDVEPWPFGVVVRVQRTNWLSEKLEESLFWQDFWSHIMKTCWYQ